MCGAQRKPDVVGRQATGQQARPVGDLRHLPPVEPLSAAPLLAGRVTVEQETARVRIGRQAGEGAPLLPTHRDRLPERPMERTGERVVLAAVELQQVRLQGFDDLLDLGPRIVHHQRHHADFLRHQVAQHARLPQQQPARAARCEHQADVVRTQFHRQADILGAGQPAELDARMHGGRVTRQLSRWRQAGSLPTAGPIRPDTAD